MFKNILSSTGTRSVTVQVKGNETGAVATVTITQEAATTAFYWKNDTSNQFLVKPSTASNYTPILGGGGKSINHVRGGTWNIQNTGVAITVTLYAYNNSTGGKGNAILSDRSFTPMQTATVLVPWNGPYPDVLIYSNDEPI